MKRLLLLVALSVGLAQPLHAAESAPAKPKLLTAPIATKGGKYFIVLVIPGDDHQEVRVMAQNAYHNNISLNEGELEARYAGVKLKVSGKGHSFRIDHAISRPAVITFEISHEGQKETIEVQVN